VDLFSPIKLKTEVPLESVGNPEKFGIPSLPIFTKKCMTKATLAPCHTFPCTFGVPYFDNFATDSTKTS